MANVQHAALTGAELHEPKGIAAAGANTVYVANGAGSGTHQKITADEVDATLLPAAVNYPIILDSQYSRVHLVSGTYSGKRSYKPTMRCVVPITGTISNIRAISQYGEATGGITYSITTTTTAGAVSDGTLTFTSTYSAAQIQSSTPSTNTSVTAGDVITIGISAGGYIGGAFTDQGAGQPAADFDSFIITLTITT